MNSEKIMQIGDPKMAEERLPAKDEKQDSISLQPAYPFLRDSLNHIIPTLMDLLNLDGCEIYLCYKSKNNLDLFFRSGKELHNWEGSIPLNQESLLTAQYDKRETRVVNLPNRRITELNMELREKAFGQVVYLPLAVGMEIYGVACLAHTRRNMLTDQEMTFFQSIMEELASMVAYEIYNQQARIQIITEERERIGMDLHDGIIQSLYGIGLSLENSRLSLSQGKTNGVQQIEKALEALQSAIADIRAYILDLRPKQLRHSNMLEGMRSLIREFRANTMVEVSLEGSPDDVEGLARPQIDALYHIFQEALSNTAKHAKATKVTVRLWRTDERVMLKVSDDGTGFDTPRPGGRIGHGLTNMQARAEAAGGGMEVISIRKQGTTLLAWVPFVKE
jgi:signal transduction histidine kinase